MLRHLSSRRIVGRLKASVDFQLSNATTNAPLEGFDFGAEVEASEPGRDEASLQKIRDISRLRKEDWNAAHGIKPFDQNVYPLHYTVCYQRRMLAQYGLASKVNPGIFWPTKEEMEDRLEFESVTYPYTIQEVAEQEAIKSAGEEQARWKRDEQVVKNIAEMNKFREALQKKRREEQEVLRVAQERKQRLIAEVREHFNYSINERDDRFKAELLERAKKLKEKEKLTRKAIKTEKKEERKAAAAEIARKKLMEEIM